MTLSHGVDTFTDIFLLVRVDDSWRIANKAYHRQAEAPGPARPAVPTCSTG
ncbi:nuclear transport factor 2 family protein [Streptomyces sp. NBC_00012]